MEGLAGHIRLIHRRINFGWSWVNANIPQKSNYNGCQKKTPQGAAIPMLKLKTEKTMEKIQQQKLRLMT